MAVRTIQLLAIKPKASMRDGCLELQTPLLLRVLSLGGYKRTVRVDATSRCFEIERRLFGKSERRVIPFDEVRRLDYRFSETGTNTGSAWLGSQDTQECFTVSAVLKHQDEDVVLARFLGEGSVDYGWESFLAGDDAVDYRGDQEEQSLGFVKLLQLMTGLPLT